MPLGPYQDFEACIVDQQNKGKSEGAAHRICGALKERVEKQASEDGNWTAEEKKLRKKAAAEGVFDPALMTEQEIEEYANIRKGLEGITEDEVDVLTKGELYEAMQALAFDPDADLSEPEITEAFITENEEGDELEYASDVLSRMCRKSLPSLQAHSIKTENQAKTEEKALIQRTTRGTTQQQSELGGSKFTADISKVDIIETPYPPELMMAFLEADETHYRCCRAKSIDAVGRAFNVVPTSTVRPKEAGDKEKTDRDGVKTPATESDDDIRDKDGRPVPGKEQQDIMFGVPVGPDAIALQGLGATPAGEGPGVPGMENLQAASGIGNIKSANNGGGIATISKSVADTLKSVLKNPFKGPARKKIVEQKTIDEETQIVNDFLRDANDMIGMEGVLERAAMDYESIGWAAIEVIRSVNMKVARVAHAPALRMRALKAWQGFVEIVSNDRSDGSRVTSGKYMYYQPFGSKVLSKKRVDPITMKNLPYDPELDGELSPANCVWNYIDRATGEPTTDPTRAANEILWVPRHHNNTIYYGVTDVLPSLGWLLANIHIRDYLLQFFEHNCVPRYAVVIEGGRLSEGVKKLIKAYFSTGVKGKAHKTLIIPIPAMRGEVKVRFEKLDADNNEGGFQETKKNNAASIRTAHGIPAAVLGVSENSELGSGKGLSQAEIYKDRIVTPNQKYWERKLNKLIRKGLGLTQVRLEFSPLDIRDMEIEKNVLIAWLQTGALTLNEVRKKAGLGDPLPGGDRAFIIIGNQIYFVDELTTMSGPETEEMENEIENLKLQQEVKSKVDMATRAAQVGQGGPGQPGVNGNKPKAGERTSGVTPGKDPGKNKQTDATQAGAATRKNSNVAKR